MQSTVWKQISPLLVPFNSAECKYNNNNNNNNNNLAVKELGHLLTRSGPFYIKKLT
jgi:hypothetical protein